MPLKVTIRTAKMISVHDNLETLRFHVPNVVPGEYLIPGIDMEPAEIHRLCRMTVREPGQPDGELMPYAQLKELDGKRYLELTIFEAETFTHMPAQQRFDQFNVPMTPDVARMAQPVYPEQLANQIESDYGKLGIIAIAGDEPTAEELARALGLNLKWKYSMIEYTSKYFQMLGTRQVTDQARRVAHKLYEQKRLSPLPEWATVAPNAKLDENFFNCNVCGKVIPKNIIRCDGCAAVYDWRKAVEFGLVAPANVPPLKRAEAGLEPAAPAAPELSPAQPEAPPIT